MRRFVMVMGFCLALISGWALAQEKGQSDAEKFKEFKAGSDTTYNWVTDIKEGIAKMKEDKCPGFIYFYSPKPDDLEAKKIAYFFEAKIFANPDMSTVGGKFITMKVKNNDDLQMTGPWENFKDQTLIVFLDPHGKIVQRMTRPSLPGFKQITTAMAKKFAPKAAKAEEEGGKKEEKKKGAEEKEEGGKEKKGKEE